MNRRRWTVAGIALLGLATAAGVWRAVAAPAGPAPSSAASIATGSAVVTRGTVTRRVQVAGVLGYDGAYTVTNQLSPGILTAQPDPGTAVVRGADLYAVSGRPAVLLYGGTPAYRDFAAGMGDGPDVRELEENLVTLGMDPAHAITVDDHFGPATTAAIRHWQAARGLPADRRSGTLTLGEVVFLPGALRVSQAPLTLGASIGPSEVVLSGTSTGQVVTVALGTDRQSLVHVGDQVLVSGPGIPGEVTGSIARIGRVAAQASGADGNAPPTIAVTVALRGPVEAGNLDQAPVQVAIVTAQHADVLMVPVTALLAGPGGGYQVRVLGIGGPTLVDVRPGLYDDDAGTVEVSGAGLAPGLRVEVPAS